MKLFEIYAKDHRELYNYLKSSMSNDEKVRILVDDFREYVDQYCEDIFGIDAYNKQNDTNYDDFSEVSTDDIYDLIDSQNVHSFIDDCLDLITKNRDFDKSEIPSPFVFDPNRVEILPRNTWLVHFSNDAKEIYDNGFKYGVSNKELLAYTEMRDIYDKLKNKPGWNFAIDTTDVDDVVTGLKYGKKAVMFQSSGVKVLHTLERDKEVIFQGKYIKTQDMVFISKESTDWCVMSRDNKIIYKDNDIKIVIKWVKNNYHQYRHLFETIVNI